MDVWSGFAIQIVDKSGNRRIVEGPINGVLLQYDETLEALNLSTGKPKNTDRLHKTSYLKVRNNYVSDQIGVISSDLVMAQIQVKYLVDFTGDDPLKWFAVDNYVKLLCDHVRSKVKDVARKTPIRKLQSDLADIVRDTVLGKKNNGVREGLLFEENSMAVRDVDVLYFQITDKEVSQMLTQSQKAAVRGTIQVAQQETNLENQRRLEEINRELEQEKHRSAELRAKLAAEQHTRDSNLKALTLELAANLQQTERENELADVERVQQVRAKRLEIALAEHQAEITRKGDLQALTLAELAARVRGATARTGRGVQPAARGRSN